jgi:peroxiredoxin
MLRTSLHSIATTLGFYLTCRFFHADLVLWLVFPLGILAGLAAKPIENNLIRHLLLFFISSTAISFLISIVDPMTWIHFPFLPASAFITATVVLGIEFKRMPQIASIRNSELILYALLIFVGPLSFSASDRFEDGMWAKLLLYLGFGMLFAYRNIPWLRAQWLLAPLTILLAMAFFPSVESFMWIVLVVQPTIAIICFNLGYWFIQRGAIVKVISSGLMLLIVLLYVIFIPKIMFDQSWIEVNQKLPEFSLSRIDGNSIGTRDVRGKVVWMSFFSTTCRPCLDEMAHSQIVAKQYLQDSEVEFIAVASSQFDSFEKFINAKQFHEFGFDVGFEREPTLASVYAPKGVPVGILVDRSGTVVAKKIGFFAKDGIRFENKLSQSIEELLGE